MRDLRGRVRTAAPNTTPATSGNAGASKAAATVELHVAPDVEFGRGVQFQVAPRSQNRVAIGPGCRILDDVLIQLRGGSLELGELVEFRRGTVINLSGVLTCAGRNVISYAN